MATNRNKPNTMSSQLRDRAKEIKQIIKTSQSEISGQLKGAAKDMKQSVKASQNEFSSQLRSVAKEAKQTLKSSQGQESSQDQPFKLTADQKFFLVIGGVVGLGLILAAILFSQVAWVFPPVDHSLAVEEGRNYFISVDEDITVDCNLSYSDTYERFTCQPVTFDGEFSSYETTELRSSYTSDVDLTTDGDAFSVTVAPYRSSSFDYKSSYFSVDDLKKISTDIELKVYNSVLNKDMATQTVHITYALTDDETAQIETKHEEYVREQARKKAECEASAGQWTGSRCKSKEELEAEEREKQEAAKRAEEAKKAEEERKRQEEEAEKKRQEEEERKRREEEEAKRAEEEKSQSGGSQSSGGSSDSPSQIPQEEIWTGIAACKRAIKQAYGITVKDTEYSGGNWLGVDYVWVLKFRNYSGAYTMVTCQYNWKTGAASSSYINW